MSFSYDQCSQLPAPIEPYGDISGLGVMLGFVISAWLTILILVAFYIFSFNPSTDPFHNTRKTSSIDNQNPHKPNPVDLLIFKYAQYLRPSSMGRFKGSVVEEAFHKCILSLADTQLITGISILTSGYWSLTHEAGMSAYHWKMVVTLAWFAGITHLSTLTFLRGYFAKHTLGRLWRLLFMFLLLVLLFVGFIPTGHFEFLGGTVKLAESIDLGSALYPKDCSGFLGNESRYYFLMSDDASGRMYYTPYDTNENGAVNITEQVAQSFNDGSAGPKFCNISGKPALGSDVSFDEIDFDQMKYLRLINGSYYSSRWRNHGGSFQHRAVLYESPAACFFKGGMNQRSEAFVAMLSSLLLLTYSYLIRAAKVFESTSKFLSAFVHGGLDAAYERILERWDRRLRRSKNRGFLVIATVALSFQTSAFYTLRGFIHLYTSMFAEVVSVVLSALWGTLTLKTIKDLDESLNVSEAEWSFGQVIPLALLSTSLIPIIELVFQACFPRVLEKDSTTRKSSNQNELTLHSEAACNSGGRASQSAIQLSNLSSSGETDSQCFHSGPMINAGIEVSASTNSVRVEPTKYTELAPKVTHHPAAVQPGLERLKETAASRLQEGSTACGSVLPLSVFLMICGPMIMVILQLLPLARQVMGGLRAPGASYAPTNYLESSATIVGSLPCFVQSYVLLRLYIQRIPAGKKRTACNAWNFIFNLAMALYFAAGASVGADTVYRLIYLIPALGIIWIVQLVVALCDLLLLSLR